MLVVSSGAVSRPDSLGYKVSTPPVLGMDGGADCCPNTLHARPLPQVTNIFGGIMGYKFQGEEALRKLYASSAPKGVSYTIVRPGGLSNDAGLGPSGIEVNQKDTVIGACVLLFTKKVAEEESIGRAPLARRVHPTNRPNKQNDTE